MATQEVQRTTVVVANPHGLHMRPAAAFARRAAAFRSAIRVANGGRVADGKSPLDLMMLVALPGAELTLETEGDDAALALETLAALLGSAGEEFDDAP